MCDICHQVPCHPRCPNAPEPATVYECAFCGEPIVVGDYYYHHEGQYYHENCFEDNSASIAAKALELKAPEPTDSETEIGRCPFCNDPIYEYEERWEGENKAYHHECLMDNATKLLDVSRLIADDN